MADVAANTTVEGGTFEVRNGAVYGTTSSLSGSFTVDGGATLQGGVKGTVAAETFRMDEGATLDIAGNAPRPAPSAQQQPQGMAGGYSTFTIQATNASFGNGSRIEFNTQLNDGREQNTDLLVFNGGMVNADPAGIVVHNNGGTGGDTDAANNGNGIMLIQATGGAVTDPDAFQLDGEARGGAFDYDLFRGSLLDSDPSMANDWFLRSDFVPQEDEEELEEEEAAGETPEEIIQEEEREGLIPHPIGPGSPGEIFPTHPLPIGDLPPGIYPIIGPELATYGVVQPIARQMGFSMLGTLHERIGDTLTSESADPFASGWGRSGWVRFFGSQIDNRYEAYVEPSTTNGRLFGVQAGFDVWRGSLIPGQRDAAGLYFAYGNASTDVTGIVTNPAGTDFEFAKTGTLDLYGYSGGAYWTHYGPGGWYLDAVVQGTVYTGTAKTAFAALPTNGMGLITSLEAGYPIHIPVGFIPNFVLEPQGQILWQYTRFQSTSDGEGRVGLGATTGVTGRLGLRAQSSIITPGGEVWQPYLGANLWRNTGGNATTSFGFDQVPLLEQSTQLEFAAGLTAKINNLLSFYGQFGYMFSVGGDTDGGLRQGVTGDVGLRMTFGAPLPPPPGPIPVAAPAPAAARSYLVFFDWDKATLTARARQIIREAAVSSTRVQYTRIEVNGHTDTTGTPSYNQGLSIRRAQAVAGELVRDGVPSGAISIRGYGQTNLLVPTGPGVREPQNRRVEIILR